MHIGRALARGEDFGLDAIHACNTRIEGKLPKNCQVLKTLTPDSIGKSVEASFYMSTAADYDIYHLKQFSSIIISFRPCPPKCIFFVQIKDY